FFLARFAKKFGKRIETVPDDTMQRLVQYSWPGNVRELQNIIERAVVLTRGPVLELDANVLPPAAGASIVEHQAPEAAASRPSTLEEVEGGHIVATLKQTGWVVDAPRGAAHILGLHPNTLRSRMEKLGIKRPRPDIS